ncbi:MAG: S41 family peptidase [bacterium]
MVNKTIILTLVCMMFASCGDLFLGSDPENTPEENFEILWNDFDKTYSFFELNSINWDSLYAVYRPQVTGQTTGEQLFESISAMLAHLKDGHVNLHTPHGSYSYTGWYDRFPENFLGISHIKSQYLADFSQSYPITYGLLNDDIAYLHIRTFGASNESYKVIDRIVEDFQSMKGMVVDVRNNGGGSDRNNRTVASRFADKKRLYRYMQYRNGPNHSDFTDFIPDYIEPEGQKQFTKPVILLTNRRCFSSTETFVLAMKVLPHVSVVGDTTGGGTGNPVSRELPNGWTYLLSTWIEYTSEKESFERIGLAPGITIEISPADSLLGKDTILETAIQMLSQ